MLASPLWSLLLLYQQFPRLGVAVFPIEEYQEAINQLKKGAIAKAVFDMSK